MSVILEQDGVGEPACMPKYVPSEGCVDCHSSDYRPWQPYLLLCVAMCGFISVIWIFVGSL